MEQQLSESTLTPAFICSITPEYGIATRKFQGIPTIAISKKGRFFLSWYGGGTTEGADNYVILAVGDSPNTLKEIQIADHKDPLVRAFDPVLWMAPDGSICWFWTQSYCYGTIKGDGRLGVWMARCRNPEKSELEWETPIRVANGSIWNPPIVLRNGDWALPTAVYDGHHQCGSELPVVPELRNERFSNMVLSEDNGKTFKLQGGADVPDRCYDENLLIEQNDGILRMLVRTHYGVGESFSFDHGKTWSPGKKTEIYSPNSRFAVLRLKSGRLLMINHEYDGKEDIKAVAWRTRNLLTAYLSDDDGKTWPHKLLLEEWDGVSYPCAAEGPDGFLSIVYDFNRCHGGYIQLSRITEEDILSGHLVNKESYLNKTVSHFELKKGLKQRLEGIIPPVITPLKQNQCELDIKGLECLLEHLISGGVHGIFILGSTGEGAALPLHIRQQMITETARILNRRLPLLVGISGSSEEDSLLLGKFAEEHGASAIVAAPPCYLPVDEDELCIYYRTLAMRISLPLFLYNMPAMTKITMNPALVLRLASIPGIVGYKDSTGDMNAFHQVLLGLKDRTDFSLLVGPESLMGEAVLCGAHGGVSGGANLFPRLFVRCYEAAKKGDLAEMRKWQERIDLMQKLYSFGYNVCGVIRGLKRALKRKGICEDGVALPMRHLTVEEQRKTDAILDNLSNSDFC